MSHFSVLVIGPDHAKQLQPYHEFECTGTVDQYVKSVDQLAEAREEYDNQTETMCKSPDGKLHSFFDSKGEWKPELSKPRPDAMLKTERTYNVPEGWERVEVPTPQVKTFADFIRDYYNRECVLAGEEPDLNDTHKFGWYRLNDAGEVCELIDRTNPNKTWDWWTLGGRWSGFLKLKAGAEGSVGKKGLMGSCFEDGPGRADQARKGAIDIDGMRDDAGRKAGALWDKARVLTNGEVWESWGSVRERICGTGPAFSHDKIYEARQFYGDQAAIKALKAGDRDAFGWDLDDTLAGDRESYVNVARERAISTYALVMNGQWYAKGRMGWFGCSDDKITQDEWNRKVNELLDGLPDDTLLTVVDCHI